ncbi:hypothetical protein [Plebeiibacterium sediminum]|uniref:Xylanase n=1 Tax=Plebeiibacterium sediminum TaxID=2992112 RepID=A0AAE3SET5_9BACT|nr:hypothetical protein [Plebeiobacterium sediminum]MCW3786526.1 hypothetical protein [Plebeiobacterium sediminum]
MKRNLLFLATAVTLLLFSCSKDETLQDIEENIPKGTATINASSTQQYIRGFGGASIRGWIPDLTSYERQKAFDPNNGMGLSVLRVRVSPTPSEWIKEKPTIDAAKQYGASVIATAWSAPAWMKDNNNLVGGKLKSGNYSSFANHLKNFCTEVGGVDAISPWNEPDWECGYESMHNSAYEIASFIRNYGANCGAPVMGPESLNMNESLTTTVVNNAGSNLKYVCGHIYGKTPYYHNWGKEVWMTEHITDNSANSGNDWASAMETATEIHNCMNVGWSMWVHWYLRRSYSLIDENSNVTKRGYVVTQFAKFIRPGSNKISCTANPSSGVYTTAYKKGSKIVVVAINTNSGSVYQGFNLTGATVSGFDRYRTTSSSNLAHDSFNVSGSYYGITLPGNSITTLVSR